MNQVDEQPDEQTQPARDEDGPPGPPVPPDAEPRGYWTMSVSGPGIWVPLT